MELGLDCLTTLLRKTGNVDNHLGGVYGRFREHPTPRLRRGDYRGRPSPRLRRGDYRRREKAALGRCFGRVAGAWLARGGRRGRPVPRSGAPRRHAKLDSRLSELLLNYWTE